MKFLISRASISYDEDAAPCEKAIKEKYVVINSTTNYKMEEKEGWFIEINTLEQLLEFQNRYDDLIIIKRDDLNKDLIEIKIYDSYAE